MQVGGDLLPQRRVGAQGVAHVAEHREEVRLPESVLVDRGDRQRQELPRGQRAAVPPERHHRRVRVREPVRSDGVVAERLRGIDDHAHRLAVDDLLGAGRDAPQDRGWTVPTGAGEQRRRFVQRQQVDVVAVVERPRLVGGVEAELARAEHRLIDGAGLVLHVRPSVRHTHVASMAVEREVVEHEIAERGRALGERGVVGELGQRDERSEVLRVVHVRVPLAEPVDGLLVEPRRTARAAARRRCSSPLMPVTVNRSTGSACPARYSQAWKIRRWFSDQYQRSSRAVDGDGVGVPVAKPTEPVGDRRRHAVRELIAGAEPQREQAQDVEVRAVEPTVDAREPAGERRCRRSRPNRPDGRDLAVPARGGR